MSKFSVFMATFCLAAYLQPAISDSVYPEYEESVHKEEFSEQSGLPYDFHRYNLPVKPDDFLMSRSCEELDQAISYMLPATYSYRPGFYDNPYASAAIWGSTSSEYGFTEHLWYYLPYSWLIGYLEDGQIHKAYYKVEQLRRAKAMKNCFVK
jgi:hypothetical protein